MLHGDIVVLQNTLKVLSYSFRQCHLEFLYQVCPKSWYMFPADMTVNSDEQFKATVALKFQLTICSLCCKITAAYVRGCRLMNFKCQVFYSVQSIDVLYRHCT